MEAALLADGTLASSFLAQQAVPQSKVRWEPQAPRGGLNRRGKLKSSYKRQGAVRSERPAKHQNWEGL